jgi:hypothetical protein
VLAAGTLAALLAAHPRGVGPITTWTGDELASRTAWALAVAWSAWLVVAAFVCELALRTRRTRLARSTARAAPAFVRRLVEVAIVGSCVVATGMPAGAARPSRPPAVDQPVVRVPATVRAPAVAPAAPPAVRPAPAAPVPPPVSPARPHTHAVRSGENLWRIARAELVARGNPAPDDATIARYWHSVIDTNRSTLRSGNPNLIFPGELVALPEPA